MNDLTLWHLALIALAAGALGTLAGFFACALLTTAKAADRQPTLNLPIDRAPGNTNPSVGEEARSSPPSCPNP